MAGVYFLILIGVVQITAVFLVAFGLGGDGIILSAVRAILIHTVLILTALLMQKFPKKSKDKNHSNNLGNTYKNVQSKGLESLIKNFDLDKKITIQSAALMAIVAMISIVSFILLHNAVIDLFMRGGFYNSGEIVIGNFGMFVLLVFAMAVMPAISEELLFRGLIMKSLLPYGRIFAVVLSSFMFSLFHLNPAQTVYQFILGLLFAGVYLRTRNMWYPIILHFFNNFIIILHTYITQTLGTGSDVAFSWTVTMTVSTVVLAVLGGLILWKIVQGLRPSPEKQSLTSDEKENKKEKIVSKEKLGFKEIAWLFAGIGIAMFIWVFVWVTSGGSEDEEE